MVYRDIVYLTYAHDFLTIYYGDDVFDMLYIKRMHFISQVLIKFHCSLMSVVV